MNDLGLTAPAAQPSPTPVVPDMSFDDAMIAKNQRMADPSWRDKYLAGDVGAKAGMEALVQA